MPELPEVETIARELNVVMPGKKITGMVVKLEKMIKVSLSSFRRQVVGASVKKVHRRAKLVLFDLSSGHRPGRGPAKGGEWTMLIHLKMSGQLIWVSKRTTIVGGHPIPGGTEKLPNKFSHVVFETTGGTLFFNDQRQFGFVRLVKTAKLNDWLVTQGYGPEPLEDDFTFSVFEQILKTNRNKRLKPMLLDQKNIAGVGNIYADEACHYAKVRPGRRIRTLIPAERKLLYRGLRDVLELSIRNNGTSAQLYRRSTGEKGSMNKFLRVYGRENLPCRRCGRMIIRTVLAQRGTRYCPRCQR